MIDFAVSGKPRRLKKALFVKALEYASNYLKLDCNTFVYISFEKDMDAHGYAVDIDKHDYEVEINKSYSVTNMITTLFHELVHVRQYETGDLVSAEGKKPYRWKGKVCRADYADQPWEIEAFDLEKKMLRNFKRKHKDELRAADMG
jgi:hypothetical protein